MATKVHHLQQPLPGVKDLYTLLDVFRNRELYERMLSDLEAARKAANEAVELIAPANDIQHLNEVANVKNKEATQKLEEANTKAAEILSKAKEQARQALLPVDIEKELLAKAQVEFDELKKTHKKEWEQQQAAYKELTVQLEAQVKSLTAKHSEVSILKQSLEQKLSAFNLLSEQLK